MKAGDLFVVVGGFGNHTFLCDDKELAFPIQTLSRDEQVVYLGEYTESMMFYDRCFVAIKVLSAKGVGWVRPSELKEA